MSVLLLLLDSQCWNKDLSDVTRKSSQRGHVLQFLFMLPYVALADFLPHRQQVETCKLNSVTLTNVMYFSGFDGNGWKVHNTTKYTTKVSLFSFRKGYILHKYWVWKMFLLLSTSVNCASCVCTYSIMKSKLWLIEVNFMDPQGRD